jgi:hypothetical protein
MCSPVFINIDGRAIRLRKFVFWRGGLEAGTGLYEGIQLLNKNSLWIRFVNLTPKPSPHWRGELKARSDSSPSLDRASDAGRRLKRFVFWHGGLEAGTGLYEGIQLLNKNSLWIRFEKRRLVTISNDSNFEAKTDKDKKIQESVIKMQKGAKICLKCVGNSLFFVAVIISKSPFTRTGRHIGLPLRIPLRKRLA